MIDSTDAKPFIPKWEQTEDGRMYRCMIGRESDLEEKRGWAIAFVVRDKSGQWFWRVTGGRMIEGVEPNRKYAIKAAEEEIKYQAKSKGMKVSPSNG